MKINLRSIENRHFFEVKKKKKRAKKYSQPKKELSTSQKSIPVDLQTNKESSEARLAALASSGTKLLEKTR